MHGALSEAISVRPSAIVEPIGKPVSVFPVGCCGHAALDCMGLVSLLKCMLFYNSRVSVIFS
jgi:hypothetical protein